MTNTGVEEQFAEYTEDLLEWIKREGVGLLIAVIVAIGYWGGVVDWIVATRAVWDRCSPVWEE